jgi:hypothetical protein
MHKERVAAIAVRGEQIKTNSACRGIRSPLLPHNLVITDPAVDPTHLQLQECLLSGAARLTRHGGTRR